jgi:NitT/TauT family transport system substrate-binding protein
MKLTIQFLAAFFTLTRGLCAASTDCAAPDKVTLQLKWVPQTQFAGYYAAQDLGHYKDECLEVTIRPGGLHIEPEEVVGKGEAQFGIAWQPGMLAARDRGVPLKAIAQVFQFSGMRLLSWKNSDIRSRRKLSRAPRFGVPPFPGRQAAVLPLKVPSF